MMNLETRLLNDDKYNYQEYHTVTERCFFHWLKSFENRHINNLLTLERNQKNNDVYYREKGDNGNYKTRTVQCFGAIDAGNSLSTEFGMFNETYVNIPTSYGNGPVFFK